MFLERKRNMSSASQGLYSGSRSGDEEDEVVADIEDNASDWDENGSLSSRDRAVSDVGDSLAVPCAVLIITFVQSLNAPSFTIRSLYDAKVILTI